ncbi:PLD nuclease N-terminal domain-containing protein [Phytoactinopolyspora limicola]|uniref:PLD nuclease N-terminal domain-containing protein n=1 Tax=Phytoactinopolyspora limicola TaxID=2715536 RepID=UPI001408763F|nr:PLD nuclease N-terminal domain-containing protein [Phytoactinopolyspora limicola]
MARVLPVVVALILAVYALIDCLQTDSTRIRALNKPIWIMIILLVPVVGPILWLAAAKRRLHPRPARPVQPQRAPDDDPEFLRQLRNLDEEHEQLLNSWEANLRRREEELRKDDPPKEDPKDPPKRPDANPEEELRKRSDGGDDDR